jgi:hypothetical protein
MQRDPLSRFVSDSLETVLLDIETAINEHTTTSVEYYVARTFGGGDEFESREVIHMDDTARDLDRFRDQLSIFVALIARTEALLAARRHVSSVIGLRSSSGRP